MDIRVIDDTSYESAKILWSICFPEDQGPFLDYYFSRRTSPKMVAAAFEKEKMIAGMHIIPQRIKIGGAEKPVAFVAGVATLPEFRNHGVITRVFEWAFGYMAKQGFQATVLQPFDPKFYAKFGYMPFAERLECIFEPAGLSMEEACAPASLNALDMLYIYNDFMSRYDGYTVRNPHDSELLLEEFSMPGASSVRIGDAYALYYSDAKTAFVSEIAGGDIMPMIRHLCNGFQSVNAPLPIGHPLSKYGCSKRAVFNVIKPLDEAELMKGTGYATLLSMLERNREHFYSFDRY
jgi:GNAT superfamily N-acetyltransferase